MECESRMRIKKEEQRHKATDAALIFFSAINLSPNQDRVGPRPHGSSKFTNLLQPIPRPWPWLMFYISSLSRHEPSSSWSPITRGQELVVVVKVAAGWVQVFTRRGLGKLQARERRVKYLDIAHIGHSKLSMGTRYVKNYGKLSFVNCRNSTN